VNVVKVVLSGGGTGGHIYPALAIAKEIRKKNPDSSLLYIGTHNGLEKDIVKKADIPFAAIEVAGFKRKLTIANLKTAVLFLKGVQRAKQLLREFQPDIVVGTGGYVCGPVVYAAAKTGIPTLIHEQNVVPGLTNKFLSRFVDCVAVSFPGSEHAFHKARNTVVTGNPRATEVIRANGMNGRKALNIPESCDIVVVVGGSRGAKALNEAMIDMVPYLPGLPETHFVYVTGKPYYDSTVRQIRETRGPLPKNMHIVPYLDNMPDVLAATSLIIGRSGASSLAEITALGIPSILVPSPNVTNNHQEANARWLAGEGAAELVLEKDLRGKDLFHLIEKMMRDPACRRRMSAMARRLGMPDAAELIYQQMERLIRQKN
jgi:UDP-N-acetylglucosamine--N-acetylmuramyl-(pentapeptide) pyrophosphoryl-undecaprenol N-acetylglucosamine transferase